MGAKMFGKLIFETIYTIMISLDEVKKDLIRVGKKVGKIPTMRDYKKFGKFGNRTFYRIFGSWNNLLKEVFGKGDLSQVIPKFQKIPQEGGKSIPADTVFYDDDFDNKKIIVNPNVMQFFIHYRMLLEPFVVLELVKFLDSIKSSPGIVSKIEAPKFERTTLKLEERVLNKYFKFAG